MCRHPHCRNRNPFFCLVPPYILNSIARNGTQSQREAAIRTKAVDNTLRAMRLSNQNIQQTKRVVQLAQSLEKRRTVYTAKGTQTLPGTLARAEGQGATGDLAVDEAYDGLGITFDFFAQVFDRNSIDDAGMRLDATVHFGEDYNNAFWNSAQMVFGDGDGELFNRFTIALEVIGHELSHGVIEDEAQLVYFNQSGALNESVADVFGALIKQFALGQTADQADWLIGVGLFAPGINGKALRSMRDPGSAFDDNLIGKDPQPQHMDQFVRTFEDNGGVHINSGIPNHAFYQIATRIGGHAWEKAGRIWYDALRDPRVRPDSGFLSFARVTADVAGRRHGIDSTVHQAVSEGWAAVGIVI
ncbi:Protease PrtS [Pseudomonas fluorescens]|nr:Protease PrtS [Pseudomonas fluorescens]